jgi:hypothetical protein
VDAAINGWNAKWTPIWFNKVGSGCNPMDNPLDVYTGFDNDPNKPVWTSNYGRDCFFPSFKGHMCMARSPRGVDRLFGPCHSGV